MNTIRRRAWGWYVSLISPPPQGDQPSKRPWGLVLLLLGRMIMALANLPVLWLISRALDIAIPAADIMGLLLIGIGILACRLLAALATLVMARPIATRLRRITADMRSAMLAGLYGLDWRDRAQLDSPRAQGRIVHDSERVEQMSHALFNALLPSVAPLLVFTAVMALLSWQLTLLLLIVAPLMRLFSWMTTKQLKRSIGAYQSAFEVFHIATTRALSLLPVARMQANEASALARHRSRVDGLAAAGTDMTTSSVANTQAIAMASSIVAVLVLVVGGIAVARGTMTVGALAAFFIAATQVNGSISNLLGGLPVLLGGDEALIRITTLREEGRANIDSGDQQPDFSAPLVASAVSFNHGDRKILQNVSLTIAPGQLTAIAAANGQGKTTLIELLAGLLRAETGSIALGETPIAALASNQYRAGLGILPQQPVFVDGSVRDNLLCDRPDIAPDDIAEAIRLADLQPVLDRLGAGLDAQIGDGGQRLSGGERQRLALARALIGRPHLLLLDEPSNHLDEGGLAIIIDRLLTAPGRPTCLVATHDPRLLALADQIYDLHNGRMTLRHNALQAAQ